MFDMIGWKQIEMESLLFMDYFVGPFHFISFWVAQWPKDSDVEIFGYILKGVVCGDIHKLEQYSMNDN